MVMYSGAINAYLLGGQASTGLWQVTAASTTTYTQAHRVRHVLCAHGDDSGREARVVTTLHLLVSDGLLSMR